MKPTGFATIGNGRAISGPLLSSQVPQTPCASGPLQEPGPLQCDPDHQRLLLRLYRDKPQPVAVRCCQGGESRKLGNISLIGDVLDIGETDAEFHDAFLVLQRHVAQNYTGSMLHAAVAKEETSVAHQVLDQSSQHARSYFDKTPVSNKGMPVANVVRTKAGYDDTDYIKEATEKAWTATTGTCTRPSQRN